MTILRTLPRLVKFYSIYNSIHSVGIFAFTPRRFASRKALHNLLVSMPKEPVHLEKLKSIRKEKRETNVKYPAGFINLQVLGNGAVGAPSSLYIFTDQTRYIFNCGEGSQRLAHEHKVKLSKLEHIFVTSKLWNRIGGLPGLVLTIQDIGVPSITIHGPPDLDQLFQGTRRFVILKDLQIHVADCTNADVNHYEDHVMRIEYVPIHASKEFESQEKESSSASEGSTSEDDSIDYYSKAKSQKRPLEIIRDDLKVKRAKPISDQPSSADSVICYICRAREKPGTLIIEKCVELGVPPGPLLGKLKSGEDVTLPNGSIVKAEQVTTPHDPGPVFIVVDCPDLKYLDSLVENNLFAPYQVGGAEKENVHVVAHFSPKHVMSDARYKKWMEEFQPTAQHLLMNDLCRGTGSEAIYRVQYKLNQLDSDIFPLLGDSSMPVKDVDNLELLTLEKPACLQNTAVPILMGRTLLRYNLRPIIQLDAQHTATISPAAFIQETKDTPDFLVELEKYKASMESLSVPVQEYPKIIFLGTGSCIPNKTRNVSGILVQLNSESYILLDCGEGTFGQIVRFFGHEQVDKVLTSLKAVYVSHLHADHHLGLVNVIMARAESFKKLNMPMVPLILLAPNQITAWMQLFHKNFHKIKSDYTLIPLSSLYFQGQAIEPEELRTKILEPLDLESFATCGVRHCPNAFGVAFTGTSKWKLTYSGDTMPADYLVTLGQNSDVLIHEATMEDELKEEAVHKMHSTVSEAIEIGKRMNAKFTLLTHFSQRYAKVPKMGNELQENVGIAFDNMCVRLSDICRIPRMYPALKTLFAEHYEEMEIKTAKKMKRKEKLLAGAAGGGGADGNGLDLHNLQAKPQAQNKMKSSKAN